MAMLFVLGACADPAADDGGTTTTLSYVEEGKELYDTYCAACHGVDGVGTGAGPSLLLPEYLPDQMDDTAFLVAVTEGVEPSEEWGGMSPIPALEHSQIARITAYVRELQTEAG